MSIFNYMVTGTDVVPGASGGAAEGGKSHVTMNDRDMGDTAHGGRTRPWVLPALVVLVMLPLPVGAYVLGIRALSTVGDAGPVQHLLRDQVLLIVAGLLVSSIGGALIWSTASSLAREAAIEAPRDRRDDRRAERLPDSAGLSSSVTRMLGTIERQSDEIARVTGQLDSAHRELDSARNRLDEATFIDAATTLYNDRFFVVRLEQEVARYQRFGRPLALVLIDLRCVGAAGADGEVADVLRGVGEALVKNSRAVDVICRHRRDQLAVLLVETPRAEAVAYASRVADLLSTGRWTHGGRQVTASVGIASLPEDARSGHDLVQIAADALDAAPHSGRSGASTYGGSSATPAARPEVGTA